MRIPAVLLTSILVVNSLFFPGATDRLIELGPLAITREGLTFRLISAARVLVVSSRPSCSCSRPSPTTCSRRSSRAASAIALRSSILSAVEPVPRMQARAGRSSRPSRRAGWPSRLLRPLDPLPRAAHRPRLAGLAYRCPRANVRAEPAAWSAFTADGLSHCRRPAGRPGDALAAHCGVPRRGDRGRDGRYPMTEAATEASGLHLPVSGSAIRAGGSRRSSTSASSLPRANGSA